MWITIFKSRKTNFSDIFFCNAFTFGFYHSAKFQTKSHISHHACPWHQSKILKNKSTVRAWGFHRFAINQNFTTCGWQQPSNDFQQSRLTTPGRPKQRGQLTSGEVQAQITKSLSLSIIFIYVPYSNSVVSRFGHFSHMISMFDDVILVESRRFSGTLCKFIFNPFQYIQKQHSKNNN